jgi:hypothetical protein
MAPKRNKVGSAELLRQLKDAVTNMPEVVPNGWKTAWELQDEWNFSVAHTGRLIRAGIDNGILEMRKFRIATERRGAFPTPHYRKKN